MTNITFYFFVCLFVFKAGEVECFLSDLYNYKLMSMENFIRNQGKELILSKYSRPDVRLLPSIPSNVNCLFVFDFKEKIDFLFLAKLLGVIFSIKFEFNLTFIRSFTIRTAYSFCFLSTFSSYWFVRK